jgi:hypothetical protein
MIYQRINSEWIKFEFEVDSFKVGFEQLTLEVTLYSFINPTASHNVDYNYRHLAYSIYSLNLRRLANFNSLKHLK